MKDEAQVRAPLTKSIVELLDHQPGGVSQAVRGRARAEIARVEECTRVDWIPLEVQLAILDALRREVGQEECERFLAAHFAATIEQPFVRGMFETAVRLFGMGPGAVFRVFPRTWSTITRGCGEVEIREIDPRGTTIRVSELPVEQPHIELFAKGFRATFQGVIQTFAVPGEVEMLSFDRAARTSEYRAYWT
jgi:hypothetical protein